MLRTHRDKKVAEGFSTFLLSYWKNKPSDHLSSVGLMRAAKKRPMFMAEKINCHSDNSRLTRWISTRILKFARGGPDDYEY